MVIKMENFTRFDIDESVQNVINTAVNYDLIDHVVVYALAIKHGTHFARLVDEIIEIAYANIHVDGNAHREVVKAAEVFWSK